MFGDDIINFSVLDIYFVFNIFIFILGLFIFFKTTPDLLKKTDYIIFKVFIIAFCFYVIITSVWSMQEYDVIKLPRIPFLIVCLLSYSSVLFNGYCFYAFTVNYFDFNKKKLRYVDAIGTVPFLVGVVLLIVSIFNGMIFSLSDSNHTVMGPLYILLPLSAFIYFIIIIIVSIINAIKAKSSVTRRYALTLIASIIFLIIWVLLDDNFDRITIIPIAIFSVIFFMFVSLQQNSIYTDALTQMNNRRRAMEFFTSQKDSISQNNSLYVFLFDINYFKEINDTYGHVEGDEALIILASAIKKSFVSHNGFSSRYGGDEFMCAWRKQNDSSTDPNEIVYEIREASRKRCKELEKPYDLSISVGIVEFSDFNMTFDECVKKVDEALYEDKKRYHKEYR